jgi:hypothetical protein
MKTLVALVACLSLCACVANTESHATDTSAGTPSNNGDYGEYGHGGDEGYGCNQASYVHVTVDGHDYWVQVPTLCNPNPDIYKGDPGPDMGDPFKDNEGPVTREQIVEKLYARLAAPSGAHSSPVQ